MSPLQRIFSSKEFTPILAFIRLGRPHFLAGGFLLHGLGVAIALYTGVPLKLSALLWGQVAVTATQLMTHYGNEFFDLPADQANPTPTRWAGGSRVLPEGRLPPQAALATAVVFGLLALAAVAVLAWVIQPGMLTAALLILALVLAWEYSAPPLRLHSRGLGELTVALVVAGLTPLVGFYLQSGRLGLLPLLAVVPLGCLQFAQMLSIEFPDRAGDDAVGKRTLVVRLGGARTARLFGFALLAAYAALPALVFIGLPPAVAAAAGLTAPLAFWLGRRVLRGDWAEPARWDSLAFWSITLLIGTAVAELLAFVWLLFRSPLTPQ
ncbi:MAG: prenyltransferase [Anaerolineae bacterium]